jgi:diguanylate cyclase (GGDEF)-like protein/PAS domain S-box-containing protein
MQSEDRFKPRVMRKRPLHILFIEDNPADAELCLCELKEAQVEARVDVVQTPEEFAERLREKPYDIILADYALQQWTGMDAFDLLKEQGPDTPFILVTGALGEEKAVECLRRGVADYILKDQLARLPVAVCRAIEERFVREERQRAEALLRESEAKFRTLAETIASAIFIHQGTQCRYVNRAAEAITGYSREELLSASSWDLIHPDSRELVIEKALKRIGGDQSASRYEVKILTKQGEARWLDATVGKIAFDGHPAGLTTAFDITERKQAEEEIRHLVASDPLTGLANYRRLLDVFEAETQRSGRTGRCFALLLLDLNGLKKINDTHGHLVGSRALCRLAHTLRLQCRVVDTAARHGGDEFAIILPETDGEGARNLALRVAEHLAQDGEQPPLSFSFGVAVYPRDGKTMDEMLGAADRALYEMKGSARKSMPEPRRTSYKKAVSP